jgi:hypothetical protein
VNAPEIGKEMNVWNAEYFKINAGGNKKGNQN